MIAGLALLWFLFAVGLCKPSGCHLGGYLDPPGVSVPPGFENFPGTDIEDGASTVFFWTADADIFLTLSPVMVPVNPPDLAGPRLIPNPIPEDPDFDDGACNSRGVLIPFVESYFSSGSFEGVIGLAAPIVPP